MQSTIFNWASWHILSYTGWFKHNGFKHIRLPALHKLILKKLENSPRTQWSYFSRYQAQISFRHLRLPLAWLIVCSALVPSHPSCRLCSRPPPGVTQNLPLAGMEQRTTSIRLWPTASHWDQGSSPYVDKKDRIHVGQIYYLCNNSHLNY